jgi:hypothetical protein
MSEIPVDGPEVPLEEVQALSALEKAFLEALAKAPREHVLHRVMAMFPKIPVEIDTSAFHSRVQKVSVSMPEDLVAAVRERTGAGGFSRYVAEAVERQLQHDQLGDLLDELDAEYGPTSPELLTWAEHQWPDYDQE